MMRGIDVLGKMTGFKFHGSTLIAINFDVESRANIEEKRGRKKGMIVKNPFYCEGVFPFFGPVAEAGRAL